MQSAQSPQQRRWKSHHGSGPEKHLHQTTRLETRKTNHHIQEGVTKQGDQVTLPSGGTDLSPSPVPRSTALLMEVSTSPRNRSLGAFHTWFSLLKFHTSEEL